MNQFVQKKKKQYESRNKSRNTTIELNIFHLQIKIIY